MTVPSFRVDDKVVVVTGASKGLGRAMALGFAESGADVVVASRKLDGVRAGGRRGPRPRRRALAVSCHVGDWQQCGELIEATVAEFGRVDVLVNNAGIAPVPPSLLGITEELYDEDDGRELQGTAAAHRPGGRAHGPGQLGDQHQLEGVAAAEPLHHRLRRGQGGPEHADQGRRPGARPTTASG